MKQEELSTDILDQLLADFKGSEEHETLIPKATKPTSHTGYMPKRLHGIDHDGFSQWLRSKEQVRKALQDQFGKPSITLTRCIQLYTMYNMKIDEPVTLYFPLKDVKKYREYDRDMQNGWTGKLTQAEYDELGADIEKNGIHTPGVLIISVVSGADYAAYLGEGNHRLRIAEELGQELFPLNFSYTYGAVGNG